jgi:chloramphenicol-sensitive protein RarD
MNQLTPQEAHRRGLAAAFAAYITWGLVPIYFKLLVTVGAMEIIAHRVIWAVPVLLLFLLFRDGRALWRNLRINARQAAWLLVSGLLVAVNWLMFVWAIVNDNVLATSLGYFINPLVNVLFGFLFLGERLDAWQRWAVGIAAIGTAYFGWYLGQPPWLSLGLAVTFGLYGLVRKRLSLGPMRGLFWEFLLLSLPCLGYLVWRQSNGALDFGSGARATDFWLVASGLVTVLPLIWFNMAAQRLTLTLLGFIQYLAPSISFLLAVFLWDESFTQGHAVAFGCIWTALLLVSIGTLQRRGRVRVQPLD